MGRPKATGDVKLSAKITFCLAKKEKTMLEQAAERSGLATGIFIREKLFKGKFPEPKIAKVDLDTFLELKKIGVNINQLARHVNSGKVPKDILTVLTKLLAYERIIINLLLDDSEPEDR